ncbi:MAG: DUF2188 domain-containing protein [Desulfotomaculaceae bacterium]|nr:DUF2188 domain-containing protein [Desulfotomaculaceae bacterium]
MKNKPVHTVPNKNGGWDNKREGSSRASSHADTKAEATAYGRQLAQNSKTEHVIHNKDGKISQKNSYGNDPFPPRDKK